MNEIFEAGAPLPVLQSASLHDAEVALIMYAMRKHTVLQKAAGELHISRHALARKLKRYDLAHLRLHMGADTTYSNALKERYCSETNPEGTS